MTERSPSTADGPSPVWSYMDEALETLFGDGDEVRAMSAIAGSAGTPVAVGEIADEAAVAKDTVRHVARRLEEIDVLAMEDEDGRTVLHARDRDGVIRNLRRLHETVAHRHGRADDR